MNNKKSHALCSASGASRWLACPGSVGLSKDLPFEPPSFYAQEGTKAHELAEDFLVQILQENLTYPNPPQWWVDKINELYPDEMIQAAIMYVDKVMAERKRFSHEPSLRIEGKLTLHQDLSLYGTADIALTGLIDGVENGIILDFKYGKTKVLAKDNPQLAYYACALRRTSNRKLQKIKVAIIQPRIKTPITEVEYNLNELDEWEKELIKAAEKAYMQILMPSKREFIKGDHCKWCRAFSICPEQNKMPGINEGLEFLEEGA